MPHRFEGGLFDQECIHGLGRKAWCTICNGRDAAEAASRQKKQPAVDQVVEVPNCSVCVKKAAKYGGHTNHRRYRAITSPETINGRNPNRAVAWEQHRAIWKATHVDDAGRQVCDECCNGRCSGCRNWVPGRGTPRLAEVRATRVSIDDRVKLSDVNPVWQHITGVSVTAGV